MIATLILWLPAYVATTIPDSGRREFLISNTDHDASLKISVERLSNDCRKPMQKLLLPITAGVNSAMNKSELIQIDCNWLKAHGKIEGQASVPARE